MKQFVILSVLLAAACGGGIGAPGSEATAPSASTPNSGTLHGKPFVPVEAAAGLAPGDGGLSIALSNTADFCGTVQQGHWPRDWSGLKFLLWSFDQRGNVLMPTAGTYPIGGASDKTASVEYRSEGHVCEEQLAEKATGVSGSIVVASGSNGAWSGAYDVLFDNGDHITGSFSAGDCPVLSNFQFICGPVATAAVSGTVSGSSGSIHGNGFAPMDAMVNIRTSAIGGSYAQINLFDQPAVCAAIQSFKYPSGLGDLIIDLSDSASDDPSSAAPPVAPGTYPVLSRATAGPGAGGAFYKNDSNHDLISADSAQIRGGSVTLTSISAGAYVGAYDLTMDTGEQISGSFTAPYCPDF